VIKLLLSKYKPTSGFAHFLHVALLVVLPVAVFVFVRLDFAPIALALVILSKWRMFAVRPRFWTANIRANAVDLMVGIPTVIFMTHTDSFLVQAAWAVLYAGWLLLIKPKSGALMVMTQAFIAQLAALSALYLVWTDGPAAGLTLGTGLICFLSARHFFDNFDEPYARMLSYVWGYFGAALAWLLGHWLLFYTVIAQPTLLLSTIGYGLAVLYYLDHTERLSKGVRQQFIFVMLAVVLVVLAFSDWGDKVI
jgi:hypothetical protein